MKSFEMFTMNYLVALVRGIAKTVIPNLFRDLQDYEMLKQVQHDAVELRGIYPKRLKTGLILLFLVVLICFFAGCKKQDNRAVLKFSSWGSESEIKVINPVLKEFEKQNPDIKLEFIHIPKDYFQKLHLLVASNLAPDVIFINNINEPIYAENNKLMDLTDFLKKDGTISKKDFFPQSLQAFTYKGALYAIPRDISNLVVYYNQEIFDRANLPYPSDNWTFNDFLETAKKLTLHSKNPDKKRFGVGFEDQPLFWTPFLWSNGGGVISHDLKNVLINKPQSLEAIQFYADLRNKYHVAPTLSEAGSATMTQLFMQGKIAMQINGRWSVPRYRKDLTFKWNIIKFPSGKAGSIVDADASGWSISKDCKNPEKAWRLVRFLAGKKAISEFTKDGLIVPARIDVANSDIFLNKSQPPKNSVLFIKIIPQSMPTPANQNYQEIIDTINTALEPVWNGDKTTNQAITPDVVKKIKELL